MLTPEELEELKKLEESEETKRLQELRTKLDEEKKETGNKTFSQAEVDAAIAKRVAAATADLNEKVKKMEEASMTEKELMEKRQEEEQKKTKEYILQLETETRINYAQSLLAKKGLPSEQVHAEAFAPFTKETIKTMIDAQAEVVKKALEEKAKLNAPNAPKSIISTNKQQNQSNYVDPRAELEKLGMV